MSTVADELRTWLANITQRFGVNGETGVDIGLPYNTPIYSLTSGRVVGAGYYGGGGVESILAAPGESVYYQHLSTNLLTPGQTVQAGQLIGYSGGQLGYGNHPSSPQFSSGPHIEVGLNAPYGGMWAPAGANVNPLPWLQALEAGNQALVATFGGAPGTTGPGINGAGTPGSTGAVGPDFPGASQLNTIAGFFSGIAPWFGDPLRLFKLVVGVVIILVALLAAFNSSRAGQATRQAIQTGTKAAAAAAA